MGDAPKLAGPDLSDGVALTDLSEGKPLAGHVGDEGVMLVRRGDEIFAVGATCTHYSGPLAEGLVVGDTVRCPWHHACFDLRSGEAVKAPALNPIACFAVVREGERVRVGEKLPPAATPALTSSQPQRIVIVGAGAAGHAAAEQLRLRGYRGQLVLIGADEAGPVDRPNLSKDYLAGTAPEEWMPLRPREWFAEHGIELVLGTPVTRLDVQKRNVLLANGRSYDFDRLLLATGAEPIELTVPGADRPEVHTLRTLADSRAIIARAGKGRRALVVGSSFIGLEVAAALRAREVAVQVVAPETVPLGKVMGPELGAYIRQLHEEHGVVFHLGTRTQSIDAGSSGALLVRLEDGSALEADLVVVGIGVRPATELAAQAGLAVDNGVLVDDKLQTSAPGIYAAGDLARFVDRQGQRLRVEHWAVAERMGQTAARNMIGATIPGSDGRWNDVPFFWSQHYDVAINYVGSGVGWERVELDGKPADKDCAARFYRGATLLAVATIFRDRESLEAEVALEQR
jgi:NADPH-dependent 2,4-dienoyl-CoA reductase/sulfur reductase-like enzyme/nitrite reductase/ring-hydroxylating ferredoxin subunit